MNRGDIRVEGRSVPEGRPVCEDGGRPFAGNQGVPHPVSGEFAVSDCCIIAQTLEYFFIIN